MKRSSTLLAGAMAIVALIIPELRADSGVQSRERGRFGAERAFRGCECGERAYRRQSGQGLIDREEWKAERKLSAWHHGDRSRGRAARRHVLRLDG